MFAELPLKLRIGLWLTDIPTPEMGNFVYVPGSHQPDYDGEHGGIGDVPGQRVLCGAAGTLTVMHCSLWHRIDRNTQGGTRMTIFLTYAPSWVAPYYRYDADWLEGRNREQRIILRAYDDFENVIRPPEEDIPLFIDDQPLGLHPREPIITRFVGAPDMSAICARSRLASSAASRARRRGALRQPQPDKCAPLAGGTGAGL